MATAKPHAVVELDAVYWKPGAHVQVAATVADAELNKIRNAHGRVTPDLVVARAKPADNPLHDEFEWDDSVAAEAHREMRARELMRWLVVVYRQPDGQRSAPLRRWVKVTPGPRDEQVTDWDDVALEPRVYVPIVPVMSEEALRRRYVQQALRDLIGWRQRYRDIAEFAAVFAAIEETAEQLSA